MSRIEWSEDYATGINVIDGQHKRIVEYLNQLDDIRESEDKAVLREVLFNLMDYTMSHFTFEETLMEEAKYPATSIHKKTHEAFSNKITSYQKRFDAGEKICEEVIAMLSAWLFDHIADDDMGYVPYVKKNM